MRFLIDVCVSHRVVEYLIRAGHDAVFVIDSNQGMVNGDILAWAHAEDRVLVTNDKDFGHHVVVLGRRYAGLIRLPNAYGQVLTDLMAQILDRHSDDLASGCVVTATPKRLRVCRPPRN